MKSFLLSMLALAGFKRPDDAQPTPAPEDGPPCRCEGCNAQSAYGYLLHVRAGPESAPFEVRFAELTTCRAHEIRRWQDLFPNLEVFQSLMPPNGPRVTHVDVERRQWNDFPAVPLDIQ